MYYNLQRSANFSPFWLKTKSEKECKKKLNNIFKVSKNERFNCLFSNFSSSSYFGTHLSGSADFAQFVSRTHSLWPYPSFQFMILPKFCNFSCLIHRSNRSNCVLSSTESITALQEFGTRFLTSGFLMSQFPPGSWVSHRGHFKFLWKLVDIFATWLWR